MIELRNLVKVFRDRKRGEVRAVDGISFQCLPGKIFGLLGANGAGKTTTLRMLATLLRPTSGGGSIAGFDLLEQPEEVRARIGFLSGTTELYGRLSVREILAYFGRLNGIEGDTLDHRIDELVRLLEMDSFADGRCDRLSTGQKQRVSIARSIVHAPPVMVFDEPTSGLDVMSSRTIMRFIERCRDDGQTVIFSTHIMSEAERLCDEIAIIHDGKIAGHGTLAELREDTGHNALERVFLRIVGEDESDGPASRHPVSNESPEEEPR
jgi:sodium transport system ATP-binding protein